MTAEQWDARLQVAIATFIDRHLATDPPPAESRLASDVRRWSDNLRADGEHRLAATGARRLAVVTTARRGPIGVVR